MFNTFFRFILSITSIAPVTGAIALSILFTGDNKLAQFAVANRYNFSLVFMPSTDETGKK